MGVTKEERSPLLVGPNELSVTLSFATDFAALDHCRSWLFRDTNQDNPYPGYCNALTHINWSTETRLIQTVRKVM